MIRICIVVFICVILPSMATAADLGVDAIKALMKLEARCEAGINYRDFAPAIGEAKFAVNLYLQENETKQNIGLAESLKKTINHYMAANSIWSVKFRTKMIGGTVDVEEGTTPEWFLKQYPEMDNTDKKLHDGGIVEYWDKKNGVIKKQLYVDGAVRYAINKASQELKNNTASYPVKTEK